MRVKFLNVPMNNNYENVLKHSPNLGHNISTSHTIGEYNCNPVFLDELNAYVDINVSQYTSNDEIVDSDTPNILNATGVEILRPYGNQKDKLFNYYYFITRYELRNYKVYRFYLELDVFTTFDVASALPNNLPVERTHLKRWSDYSGSKTLINNLDIANLINIPETVGVSTYPAKKISLYGDSKNTPIILWRYVWIEDNRPPAEKPYQKETFVQYDDKYAIGDSNYNSGATFMKDIKLLCVPMMIYPLGINNRGYIPLLYFRVNGEVVGVTATGDLNTLALNSEIKIIGSALSFLSPNNLIPNGWIGLKYENIEVKPDSMTIDLFDNVNTLYPDINVLGNKHGMYYDKNLDNYVLTICNLNNVTTLLQYTGDITINSIIGNIDFKVDDIYNVTRETKLYSSGFCKIKLKDSSNDGTNIDINKLLKHYSDSLPIKCNGFITLTGARYNYFIDSGEYSKFKEFGYGNNTIFNGEMPFKNEAYVEMLRNSRNFMLQGMLNVGAKAVNTVVSAQNPARLIGNATDTLTTFGNFLFERDNLMNAPSKVNTDGYDLLGSLSITNPFPYIEFDDVTEEGKRVAESLFYNFGYNVMTNISKNLLFSRYYFNYLKTYEDISERISTKLTNLQGQEVSVGSMVRKKISDVLQKGCKFWNFDTYDSLIDFNRNINADGQLLENWEIDLINKEN